MVELARCEASGVVGDERDAEYFHACFCGCDGFERGGHTNQIAAEDACHLDFGWGFIVWPRELGVDAFREFGIDGVCEFAQAA